MVHAFGLVTNPEEILNIGIRNINEFDINFAVEKGFKIKLTAHAHKLNGNSITAFVMPEFVKATNELYQVDGVFNGIVTENTFVNRNFFVGKGAGAFPTASAVLSDLSALSYNYKYEYKKRYQVPNFKFTNDFSVKVYIRYNSDSVDFNLFDEIIEEYRSFDTKYVVANIKIDSLKKIKESGGNNVSVILLND